MGLHLDYDDLFALIRELPRVEGPVFGIPDSGVIVAGMYAKYNRLELVFDPLKAKVILDDTVCHGREYRRYKRPGVAFMAVVWMARRSGIPLSDTNFGALVDPEQEVAFPFHHTFGSSPVPTRKRIAGFLDEPIRILVLEDLPHKIDRFRQNLRGHDVEFARTAAQAIALLGAGKFGIAFLDHDLEDNSRFSMPIEHPNTGSEVARWLVANPASMPDRVIVHSHHFKAARHMQDLLPEALLCPWAWQIVPRNFMKAKA